MAEENTTAEQTTNAVSTLISDTEESAAAQLCTVLHGFGRVSPTEKHWIDNVLFVGGVARHVPTPIAQKWKTLPHMGRNIRILPDDADDVTFAKETGIQPMATHKFAAMLTAIDVDKLAVELGPERSRELAERLLNYSDGKVVRDATGKWRKKNG